MSYTVRKRRSIRRSPLRAGTFTFVPVPGALVFVLSATTAPVEPVAKLKQATFGNVLTPPERQAL